MHRHRIIAVVVILCAVFGCVSHTVTHYPAKTEFGRPIDIAKYDQVVEGKTTESGLIALFGEPQKVIERSGGKKVLQYYHYQTQMYGSMASPAGTTGTSSHSMLMFGIANGVVVKKAKMVGGQPVGIQPETTVIAPSKEK